ncbi:hypothetical protein NDU88_003652 [Pleurodeles waltl]|uniref:Uncharacterized protein n=1 Tax=Pleurodeles waltl TaxID=8319 RepID=A0AAV7V317_PLEWA|nr:hypothetical protein NDU88_003652 [Pleurodeles waltl]
MPRGKATGKATGKTARQLLFSEALRQQKHPPTEDPLPPRANMADDMQGATMDRILQEISAVGRKLEGMDNAMGDVDGGGEIHALGYSRLPIADVRTRPTSGNGGNSNGLLDR